MYLSGMQLGVAPKIEHQNYMCLEGLGLCVQNMIIVSISSIINIIARDLYDQLMNMETFTCVMNKRFIRAPNMYEENGYELEKILEVIKSFTIF